MGKMEYNINHGKIGKHRHLKPYFGIENKKETTTDKEQRRWTSDRCFVRRGS